MMSKYMPPPPAPRVFIPANPQRKSWYYGDMNRMNKETVITARIDAIEGKTPWACDPTEKPILADVIKSGYALITFDGDRSPKVQKCVSCHALTSLAWHIMPINFTVAACCGSCVADSVDVLWGEASEQPVITLRRRGLTAENMCNLIPLDADAALDVTR